MLVEILRNVTMHCLEMQKMADTKNAGLIAFNGAVIVGILKVEFETSTHSIVVLQVYLWFVLFCSIVSIFLALSAIGTRLKHKRVISKNYNDDNLLYFGTIANFLPDEYINKLKNKYGFEDERNEYLHDVAEQTIIMAQISISKFKLFNTALKWTVAGIATPISYLVYEFFFDSNTDIKTLFKTNK